MSHTKIYVHPQFFTYHGPAEKAGNSHYICINCPNKIKNNGKLKTISVSDISRQNLYSHLSSKHPGLLSSFKAACIRGEQTPSKRNREEDSDTADLQVNKRQATIQDSLTLPLIKPLRPVALSQEEFDDVVLNYIVDSVLSLRHVETEPFRELMKQVSPSMIPLFFILNYFIIIMLY
jgi:hypothetical protein